MSKTGKKDYLETYRIVGDFQISCTCLQTFPCQHKIINKKLNLNNTLTGDKIFLLLKEHGISDEHFNVYEEYIRRRDHPTEKEMLQTIEKRKKREKLLEIQVQKYEKGEINSATKRLEKLKHNVFL